MEKNNKVKSKWYKNCEFIHDYMQFYSYQDFMIHKEAIIDVFITLDSTYRLMYQWYIWANPNITNKQKEIIWDILCRNVIFNEDKQD